MVKQIIVALLFGLMLFGCSLQGGKVKETYQSTFPSVPLSERVGGEWTGGPPGSK